LADTVDDHWFLHWTLTADLWTLLSYA